MGGQLHTMAASTPGKVPGIHWAPGPVWRSEEEEDLLKLPGL